MIKYRAVKIREIGDVVTGKTPKTSVLDNYGADYMFVGPTDLHKHFFIDNSEKMLSIKGLASIKGCILNQISILVGCIGWDMGNVALVQKKCATNQQINSITNIKSHYNPYYIYYWLKIKKKFLFQQANVTRTPILNKTDFSKIEINVPHKKYQDTVADILTVIDKKIELNNKINAELEAMAKLIYDYWFVQFDFPDANGKPYKSSGGKMVYNKELKREIPEEWGAVFLDDIIVRSGTGLNPRKHFKLGEGDNYYITIKSISNGKINFDNRCDRISDESLKIIDGRSNLQVGDVLFTSIQPVGVTYFIQEKPNNWNINESVFTLRADKKKITPEFLFMLLSSEEMKVFTRQSSTGSIHKGIRHGVLKTFKLPYGGKLIADQFTNVLNPILKQQYLILPDFVDTAMRPFCIDFQISLEL